MHHHGEEAAELFLDDILILNVRKVSEGPVATAFTQEALNSAYGGRLAMAEIDPASAKA